MIRFMVIYIVVVVLAGIVVGWAYWAYFSGGEPVRLDLGGEAREQAPGGGGPVAVVPTAEPRPSATEDRRTFAPSPMPLALPIDCDPGQDCWIINYVDADPGPGRADFACGAMSYDGHKGTDFALAHLGRIADDVAVLAAAPGRVIGVRDGMDDVSIRVGGKQAVEGRECGNGVRIDHGDGWVAQYCHLRKGSVAVRSGDVVRTGDRLGSVGLSGNTEFPHVHLTVWKDDTVVDPFVGLQGGPECSMGDAPLWRPEVLERLAYDSPLIFHLGFTDREVQLDEISTGRVTRATAAPDAPVLILFAEVAGIRPGDVLAMRLLDPRGGEVAALEHRYDRTRIVAKRYVGRKVRGSWAPGIYRGIVTVSRSTEQGTRTVRREATLEVR